MATMPVTPSDAELAGRIALAVVLGGAIGLDREISDKSAGLRTHISVGIGAAVFGIISAYGFNEFGHMARNDSSFQVDVTRVASQVVVGIGFLGGGAIVKHGATVRGLTTAASLWVTAAIGLAVGLGNYFVAGAATVGLLVALIGLRRPRRWIDRTLAQRRETIAITIAPGCEPTGLISELHHLPRIEVRSMSVRTVDEDRRVIEVDLKAGIGADLEGQLLRIARRPDVSEVDLA